MTPLLDLKSLTSKADNDLLQRVSRDLASYYMALPLAHEDGRVTVVTAHPDNSAAFQVLARLLGSEIVPIADSETAVVSAIAQVYSPHTAEQQVLSWTDDPDWQECVRSTATLYAGVLGQSVSHLPLPDSPATSLPSLTGQTPTSLLVCHLGDLSAVAHLMQQSPVSLLLVGDAPVPGTADCGLPQRVLLALRGYGSDWAAVKQVHQLSGRTPLDITVLPLAGAFERSSAPNGSRLPNMQHLEHCLKDFGAETTMLRLRGGSASDKLIAELEAAPYDLLVMAAEGYGEFVLETLQRLHAAGVHSGQPVLIIRPPVEWNPPLAVTGGSTKLSED